MIVPLRHLLGWIVSSFRSREDLIFENLALRRQLLALYGQRPRTRCCFTVSTCDVSRLDVLNGRRVLN